MIEIQHLHVAFDTLKVLDNLNLHVESHRVMLGENGSGKSSFAKALCGLIGFEGELQIDGVNYTQVSPKIWAKIVGYIPPKLENFEPYLRVYDFVLMGRYWHKKTIMGYEQVDYTKADEVLDYLEIHHLKGHRLAELSSGEAQLVLIAQALLGEAKWLIFDEPTANLDPKNGRKIFEVMCSLKQSHSLILITHDIWLANAFNEAVLFIKEGKILEYHPEEFFQSERLQALYGCTFDNYLRLQYD